MGGAAAGRASPPVETTAGRGPRVRPLPGRVRPRGRGPASRAAGRPAEPAPAYIFTRQEITALLAVAGQHRWHLPAVTYPVLFRLIAATGMRLGEALRLDDADVDLNEAMITIRDSKFGKSRRIPVDVTVVAALRDYLQRRRVLLPAPAAPAL